MSMPGYLRYLGNFFEISLSSIINPMNHNKYTIDLGQISAIFIDETLSLFS